MKAQGATEYLVVLGAILFVALMVAVVLFWPTGSTKDVRASQAGIKSGIGKIACEDLTKGLVGYYKFDDVPGATRSSIEGMPDAVFVSGATIADGIRGKAASLDGINDYATISGMNVNTAAGEKNTVAFWMNWGGGTGEMPFSWAASYDLYFRSGTNCFGFNTGNSDSIGVEFPAANYSNQWVHVAAIFYNGVPDENNTELWINGVKQGSYYCYGTTSLSKSATTSAYIGRYGTSSSYSFGGKIDDLHIYDRALSASEIEQLYENPGCP
ncbi:Concanavalin A-like lectin/glucanases superfamily protein [Candidatus Anstonella stagnisolia]|nr:Concanavalin A-like lectin/glucanases superfamily protein [Candidatus Anstonella stagnisolia]